MTLTILNGVTGFDNGKGQSRGQCNGPIYRRWAIKVRLDFGSLRTACESWPKISIHSNTYIVMCIILIWYGLFWQPPNSLGGLILPQIWNQWHQLLTYPCAYCLYGMVPFDSLWGHYSLQTASEDKFDVRFDISCLNYLLIHVHIAYMVWALAASKQPHRANLTSYFKSVTSITDITRVSRYIY